MHAGGMTVVSRIHFFAIPLFSWLVCIFFVIHYLFGWLLIDVPITDRCSNGFYDEFAMATTLWDDACGQLELEI